MGISVLLGKEHKQLEENIMKILLAIGWLLVLAFVYEADAGTIDARNEDDRQFGDEVELENCLEKAGSSEKAIEDCLHVSDVQFTQIKKMAKCLDDDFKTFEELETKITECIAANPTRIDAEKEEGLQFFEGILIGNHVCKKNNCKWSFCPKGLCKFPNILPFPWGR